jgi:hypothetical protein
MVRDMRRRRARLETERDWRIEGVIAAVEMRGALSGAELVERVDIGGEDELGAEAGAWSTCTSFQIRRPSMPPSTEMHSPEMWPAAR